MKRNYFLLSIFFMIVCCIQSCQREDLPLKTNEFNSSVNLQTRTPNSVVRLLNRRDSLILEYYFPGISFFGIWVIGEADPSYNCIAFSLGLYNIWINPPQHQQDFEYLYAHAKELYGASSNYEMVPMNYEYSEIDAYGFNPENLTHASLRYIGRDYASKLGNYITIVHPRYVNFSNSYGYPLFSFMKSLPYNNLRITAQILNDKKIIIYPNERDYIYQQVIKHQKDTSLFNHLFDKWINNWKTNPLTMLDNSTYSARKLEEYSQLLAMGPKIIPLVLEKILDSKNFVGLILYDDLQDNILMKINYSKNDLQFLEGEQNRALRTIKLWLKSQQF